MGKLKTAGLIFLICLALGAGWALWMGLKLFATIAGVALVIGLGIGAATSLRSKRRLAAPEPRSRLS